MPNPDYTDEELDKPQGKSDVSELTAALVQAWRESNAQPSAADDAFPVSKAMEQLPSYEYRYKEPYAQQYGDDKKVGPVAQDMLQNPVTAGAVKQGQDGMLHVDGGQLALANTAALSDLARRVASMEQQPQEMRMPEDSIKYDMGQINGRNAPQLGFGRFDKAGEYSEPRTPGQGDMDLAPFLRAIRELKGEMPQGGDDPMQTRAVNAPDLLKAKRAKK